MGMSVRVVTGTRLGPDEDKPAHQRGVAKRAGLCDVAADGETENVDLGESQGTDEGGRIIGPGLPRCLVSGRLSLLRRCC